MISFFNTITDRVPSHLREEQATADQLVQPLQAGQHAPLFRIAGQVDTRNMPSPDQIIARAKVVAFWSSGWNNYGTRFLKQLDAYQPAIQLMGGEVLVITDEDTWMVKGISRMHHLSLNFYRDPENQLATRFGLNGETKVTRKLFRLRKRVHPYLGLYVLAPDNSVAFSFAWSVSMKDFSFKEVLESVFGVYHAGRS